MGRRFVDKVVRRYRLRVRGIVHVGGHLGQEAETYARMGADRQLWIEPQLAVFEELRRRLASYDRAECVRVACGAIAGEATLHVTGANTGASSSLLEPAASSRASFGLEVVDRVTVPVEPLDEIVGARRDRFGDSNLLVLDVQGYELEVLRGARGTLSQQIDCVVSEVSRVPIYEGSCLEHEVEAELAERGFAKVLVRLGRGEHGDAVFLKREVMPPWLRLRLAVLGPRIVRPRGAGAAD